MENCPIRSALVLVALTLAGCLPGENPAGSARPALQRDIESYAIASCLTYQTDAYVSDQGDAWASAIVQRAQGDFDVLAEVAEQVKREIAAGAVTVIRDESNPGKAKMLPLMHCGELIDRPAVRAAINKALIALRPAYSQKQDVR